jgi:hypothetical protein
MADVLVLAIVGLLHNTVLTPWIVRADAVAILLDEDARRHIDDIESAIQNMISIGIVCSRISRLGNEEIALTACLPSSMWPRFR